MEIPTYTSQVTPQGGINAEATPADFGSQVGAATEQLGQGVGRAGDFAWRLEQDQGTVWAYEAASKSFAGMKQQFRDKVNSLDPNDPEFSSKVGSLTNDLSSQIDQQTQALQDSAPSHSAARIVAKLSAFNSRDLLNYGMGEQSRLTGAYTGKLVSDGMKSDQDSIAADPSDANFNRIMTTRMAMIGSLSTVDPTMKMKWQSDFQHGLALTQVQTMAATNPNAFLSSVDAQGGHTTIHGTVRGAVPGGAPTLPQDFGADTVKPYSAARIQSIASMTSTPSAYDDMFKAAAAKYGLDWQDLKMRGAVESGLNPNAVGPQTPNGQSVGIMQIERGNAARAGIDPTNPQQSIDWAAKQLAGYQQAAGGDASTVDKTYYGGENTAQWGKNTNQYAANLAAVRAAINPGAQAGADVPQVQPLTDSQIDASKPSISGWAHLSWGEKVNAVRQAEAAVGGQLANDRGQMDLSLRDASASLLAGKNYPGLDGQQFSQANLARLYGPVEGQRKFDQLSYVRQVGGFMGQMATMPAAQAQSTLANLAPQGGPEFADREPVFKAANEAYQRLDAVRGKDFAQYALDNNIAGAKPVDFSTPDAFQTSLHNRIAVANAGVHDYGAQAHLLSQGEVASLGDALNRMNPAQQLQYIKSIRQGTAGSDDWYRDVLGQIAPKNTTLAQAAAISTHDGKVTTAAGPQDGNMVGQYVLEGAHILQGKDLDDPTHTGRSMALDDKTMRNYFWNTVGTNAFASNDAQRSSQIANDTYQAVKNYLAADIYHRGLDPRSITQDQVKNAVTAVTGGTAKINGDSVFVPWGMDSDAFRRQFPVQAQAAIDAAGLKGTSLDKLDAYHIVNLDDGKYGLANGNRMLVGKNGRTVVVDFSGAPVATNGSPGGVSADGHVATGRIQ
ncbi:hypothetical protein BLA39750_02233 [Burkholderia lata]|uniref:Transglycosylase SLT domain-containing protein n=1 Tax=Burkholderia lata (strain ATCC 17760 / DSM 23089 / LMG 22485 / NCIMB 9086 / R18194 / 383) TaxID=482957 RepID=A0A6P2WJ54_BURL3|nr:transglycosylase SLT domain-containing protein [Burkholderia lata]VWC96062.1 hypothetical protein BLA39750_02233 [Burkholderia lata]